MAIRKQTLRVEFLYDDSVSTPAEWSLSMIANEIDHGELFGYTETLDDQPMTTEQTRQFELDHGGDGNFMILA
jgi:hypothetical protein